MELKEIRAEIDSIDRELVALLERRMDAAARVAAYKKRTGMAIYDPGREAEKLASVAALCRAETAGLIPPVFEAIMAASRAYQAAQMERTDG